MKLTKTHEVLQFKQSYIDFNTEKRKKTQLIVLKKKIS